MPAVASYTPAMQARAQEVLRLTRGTRPIWPAPYDQNTAESLWRFLTECWWTYNEANQQTELIPKLDYLEALVQDWHECYRERKPILIEKSRRLAVSWALRGCETWAMGMQRGDWLIVDQQHKNAAEHLWRIHFSLSELYERRPGLVLKRHEHRGSPLAKEITLVALPNGSSITQTYQDAASGQGKGKTGVTLEELSKYAAPAAFWSQALIFAQGKPGEPGGFVSAVANASPNPEWHDVKRGLKAREVLGL